METLNLVLTIIGSVVLALGLLSGALKNQLWLSEPLIAVLAGILVGPALLGVLDVANWGNQTHILEQAARLTLAISLMGVALRLPTGYLRRNWKMMAVLLGLVMPLMWLSSSLIAGVLLGLPVLVALLLGAVITPTDPVVSSSIVTGDAAKENIPGRLRRALSAESGANDGLAFPIVMLPLLLINQPPGEALSEWVFYTLLWEVLGAVIIGLLIGLGVGKLLHWLRETAQIKTETVSLLTVSLALSLVVLGLVKLLGSDGILAVFAAGIGMNSIINGQEDARQEHIQETVKRFFHLPVFVLLGMSLPWAAWFEMGWVAIVLIITVLLLRRLPALILLRSWIAPLQHWRDVLFIGWFGPIGVAALFYATLALRETGNEIVWTAGSLIIFASVVIHGITATPLTRLYGERDAAAQQQTARGHQGGMQPQHAE